MGGAGEGTGLRREKYTRETYGEGGSQVMKNKKKIYSALISLALLFFLSATTPAEHMRFTEDLSGQRVLLPGSAPDNGRLILVAFFTIEPEEGVLLALALYDDPRTWREVDYLELYDGAGSLLLISWIDRFGIVRTAVDIGLLEEEASDLEGVLVLLSEGTPL